MKETQNELNYSRIAEAIRFIRDNRKEQPCLEAVAEAVNMSPFHFQRIFKEWAGITPKHFLQYLNVEYAKRILHETHASLFDTAQEVGLSGTGRLHDLFITVEGMTPGEYKNGGENLLSITVSPRRLSATSLSPLLRKVFAAWSSPTTVWRRSAPCKDGSPRTVPADTRQHTAECLIHFHTGLEPTGRDKTSSERYGVSDEGVGGIA